MEYISNLKVILNEIFNSIKKNGISDIHIAANNYIFLRLKMRFLKLDYFLSKEDVDFLVKNIFLNDIAYKNLIKKGSVDTPFKYGDNLFRINVFKGENGFNIAMRHIKQEAFSIDSFISAEELKKLAKEDKGLILICGATGTGKSSTLASILEYINETQQKHIITLEDPVEYIFSKKESLIQQRELGRDFQTFPQGIYNAMRQDPDILMVGEIRDADSATATLEASETGHLVFATLHAGSIVEAVSRMMDFFKKEDSYIKRQQLSYVIKGIISQRLILVKNEIKCVMEICLGTTSVKNLIRQGKDEQILSQIQLNKKLGMITMEEALKKIKETARDEIYL